MLPSFTSPVLMSCTQCQREPGKSVGLARDFRRIPSHLLWYANVRAKLLSHCAWVYVYAVKPLCYHLKSLKKLGKISSSLSFRPSQHGLTRNWKLLAGNLFTDDSFHK